MSEVFSQESPDITIIANGQERTVRAGCTIAAFLQELAIAPARVVAQLDGAIISRADFAQSVLHEGSRLEIITLVGGG